MTILLERRMARQAYESGLALFQDGEYGQAVVKLCKAEDAFRRLEARGHPFSLRLANGVSGLPNTLALEGRCHQNLGDYQRALTCYETTLITQPFEKKDPFDLFWSALGNDIIFCYEKAFEKTAPETLSNPTQEPALDDSFLFPFSLPQELIPVARLYELAPERYMHFRTFYNNARNRDFTARRKDRKSDEFVMKKIGFAAWGAIASTWIAYTFMVVRALIQRN